MIVADALLKALGSCLSIVFFLTVLIFAVIVFTAPGTP